MNKRIAAKIIARNRVNALANVMTLQFQNVLNEFVGCKVRNKDGTMVNKLRTKFDELRAILKKFYPNEVIYVQLDEYNVRFSVKTDEPDSECSVTYAEQTQYIGRVNHGILEKIAHPETLATDYTYADYEGNAKELEAAREKVYALERRYNWMR